MVRFYLFLLFLPATVYGQVTLSEVLSNEPAGRVRLEWIELYNRSDAEADLSGFRLIVSDDTTIFQQGSLVGAGAYAVIARQLAPEDGSDSFEGYWGDSSGVWGDSEFEDFAAYQGNFQLSNNSGDVTLADSAGTFLDQLFWNSPSDDGRSIEKDDLSLDFTTWHNCYDPEGSTPGRANSEIPPGGTGTFQADISPRIISPGGNSGSDHFTLSIINPPGCEVSIEIFDESGLRRRTLVDGSQSPVLAVTWDGSDDSGATVAPGIYIIGIFLSGQKSREKHVPVVISP